VGFVARLCPSRNRTLPLDMVTEIEWASARLVTPEDYVRAAGAAHRRPPVELSVVADVYDKFREAKRRKRLVDFDDLLRLAARDLTADPVYATARRWRFRHLYVDEFQDVNPLQHQLLSAWLGPDSSLCVVGDPNQAIYAWNGADARYLVDFEQFHPGGQTVTLVDNYRSTPEILAAANGVLGTGPNTQRLRPNRSPGPVPTIRTFEDETAEARGVVRSCRDHHKPGAPWSDQAVLVRTNAQAVILAEAFGAAGIPHRVRGAGSLLEQPEVKQAIGRLSRAASVADFIADLQREAHLGDDDADTGTGDSDSDTDGVSRSGTDTGAPRSTNTPDGFTDERRANLAELVRLGREYQALDPTGGSHDFGAWLRSTLRNTDGTGDAVEIVTFHAAKGLEWPIVHVAGLEKGLVPIHFAEEDTNAIDEERRLLYVALTRAREELHCSHAARRAFGSRSLRRTPSPWLDDIRVAAAGGKPRRSKPSDVARHTAAARASLPSRDAPSAADRPLFEALRTWRREQANAASVPAFVVFNDATLRAVAERRPSSNAELLAVPGIGPVKVERFGGDLLRIVADSGS